MEIAPNKLDFYWLPPAKSGQLAAKGNALFESLRIGHGILTREQFAFELRHDAMQVIALPNDCAALVTWGEAAEGATLNILTTVGSMEHAAHALDCIEAAARARKAKVIMSVGHVGWTKLVQQHGYTVSKCILMKKVLQ